MRDASELRVLHVLSTSLPQVSGYALRSEWLLRTQASRGGLSPAAITSPFRPGAPASYEPYRGGDVPYIRCPHPVDVHLRTRPGALSRALYTLRVGGVTALRGGPAAGVGAAEPQAGRPATPTRGGPRSLAARGLALAHRLEERVLVRLFAREIARHARRLGAGLIHAHSPPACGRAALRAGRIARVPVVYEVRGLWEESCVAEGRMERGDASYRAWRAREDEVLSQADGVVTICEQLRAELTARGVDSSRLVVVPNAAEASAPSGDDADLQPVRQRLRGCVLGYVGSLRPLEGVDALIRAAGLLLRRRQDVSTLVVGDGPELAALRRLAAAEGLGARAVFTGRVAPDRVRHYYRLIDVFVVSRPPARVARLVTPLKPLEAMAAGLPVVAADLPALRELVRAGENGLLYPAGDVGGLASACAALVADAEQRRALGRRAAAWVARERTWARALEPLWPLYRELTEWNG